MTQDMISSSCSALKMIPPWHPEELFQGKWGSPVCHRCTIRRSAPLNFTNTSLPSMGLSGIFGLGFSNPDVDAIVFNLIVAELGGENAALNLSGSERTSFFISNIGGVSPLVPTMVVNGLLKQPMFTVRLVCFVASEGRLIGMYQMTLECETILPGGNIGEIMLGGLPDGISNESLTWAPVRLYQSGEGGLDPPLNNPNEVRIIPTYQIFSRNTHGVLSVFPAVSRTSQ
jgi:hypothetical protein